MIRPGLEAISGGRVNLGAAVSTARDVNRALRLLGFSVDEIHLQRAPEGYFYWRGSIGMQRGTSIYSYSLRGETLRSVLMECGCVSLIAAMRGACED